MFKKIILLMTLGLIMSSHAFAQACYKTSILAPAPFMGNHGEVFKLSDGSMWKVMGSYEYMYAYYPAVNICPGSGKLIVEGRTVNVTQVKGGSNAAGKQSSPEIKVVFKRGGCRSYFLADGDSGGIYLLEWYGGYDPSEGDVIVGDMRGYGFRDVFYPQRNASGRVYVDDYLLSTSRAIEKMKDKCN